MRQGNWPDRARMSDMEVEKMVRDLRNGDHDYALTGDAYVAKLYDEGVASEIVVCKIVRIEPA